jgi:hypothetical protein
MKLQANEIWKKRLFQIFHCARHSITTTMFYYSHLNAQINCENVVIYGNEHEMRKKSHFEAINLGRKLKYQ